MEAEESSDEKRLSEEKRIDEAWRRILGDYFTITDLSRMRRVCKKFREDIHEYLRDTSRRRTVRSDEELTAMYKLNAYPPAIRFESSKLTISGLQGIFQSGVLYDVEIVDCDHVNDQAIIMMATHCRSVNRIHIDCRSVSLAVRNGYNGTRQMTITDQAIKTLATMSSDLECLELIWARMVTDDAFLEVFGRCPQLKVFRLHWSRVSDKALKVIGDKHNLRVFDIRTCKDVSDEGIIPVFRHCVNIRQIYLVDIAITDASLRQLVNANIAAQMETLLLSDLELITDAGLIELASGITDSLKTLHLSHLKQVTNRGIAAIMAATHGVVDLSISYIGVSDEAMDLVAKNSSVLECLRVARFDGLKDLTDRGLATLAGKCNKLHLIECFNAKISEAGAKSLRSPNLEIIMSAW